MKQIAVVALLSLGLIYKFGESRANGGNKYPEMTQCLSQSNCSPVAYSNNCMAGGSSCEDRGCPKGTQEDYMYP